MAMKSRSSTNTFIDTIIRKFDQQSRNYCLVNANLSSKPIIYCNDGFCELTGFSRSEILQKPGSCEFLCGQLTSSIAKQHLREYLNASDERQIELLCYKKSGARFICSILVAPVKAENNEVILLLLSFEDITSKQGSRLFGTKAAGFQWPSSLTGAINRVVGRGPRGVASASNLSEMPPSAAGGSRRSQEGIPPYLLDDRRRSSQAPLGARRQSMLITFVDKPPLLHQHSVTSTTERRGPGTHLAGMLPAPAFGTAGFLTSAGGTEGTGASTAPSGTAASTERLAVSIAAVTGEGLDEHGLEAVAGLETAPAPGAAMQLPPTYGRFMDKLIGFKDRAMQKAVRWVSAESHPDHKLHSGRIPRFTILHYSPFKAIWDWVILFFVLYTAIFTPYSAAFLLQNERGSKQNLEDSDYSATPSFEIFNIVEFIVDVMFLIDIFINFRTTYVNKGDEVVSAPSKIAIHYLKGMFLIDAVAAIPFDLLLFGSVSDETTTLVGLLKTVRLIRLVRVARKWNKVSEYGAAVLILLMATFTLIAHWMACIWYAIASLERQYLPDPKIGWLDDLARQTKQQYLINDTTSGPTIKSKYVTALMFTFSSLTSVGFGNIAPNTTSEKIFGIVLMLIGSMMYATIFGNVSAIIQRLYSGTARYHMEMGKVKEFIKFHQIPHPLRQRLEEYFQHAWRYTNGIDMNVVLRSFPECLQADICLHLNRNLLNNNPAFKKASPGCLRQLSMKFRSSHVPPGDILVHRGDVLDALYFISRGSIEIIRDNVVLAILGKDDIFGEDPCSFKYVGKSSANVRALTYCDLHKIIREDLLDTLEMYPEFAEWFAKHLQITFDLRDEHLAVTHGPSSASNTSEDDDFFPDGGPSPGGPKGGPGPGPGPGTTAPTSLDDLPAIRIRRRRLLGTSKRRRPSNVRDLQAPKPNPMAPGERNKAAELRPMVQHVDLAADLMTEADESDTSEGIPRASSGVGGGIFEMRPDKAGQDITPANFDFPAHPRRTEADSSTFTGAISSWAGASRKGPHHVATASTMVEDEQQIPLLSQQQQQQTRQTRVGQVSTPSSSTPSSLGAGVRPRSPPPVPPPTGMLPHTQSARAQDSWHAKPTVERTGSGPANMMTDLFSKSGRAADFGTPASAAGITSSATLPDFGSSHLGTAVTLRSTPADERALAIFTDTGMRLAQTANQQEQRIAVISDRLAALETRLGNDLIGILSMLRHSQQQQHGTRPSVSTLTLTATGGTSEAAVTGGVSLVLGGLSTLSGTVPSSRTLPRMASLGESHVAGGPSASTIATAASTATIAKRPSLKHGDSSESPSDSQAQWPPPPSTEEASLNLSMGLSSDDTLPSGTEMSSSGSSPYHDDPPVSFI